MARGRGTTELTRLEKIRLWYKHRSVYEEYTDSNDAKIRRCIACKHIYRRHTKEQGIGSKFYIREDGARVIECGGENRNGFAPCAGLVIPPSGYIDSATMNKELDNAKDDILREIKHIRDRVFGTEHVTKEDDRLFNELTREYGGIRNMEEYYSNIVQTDPFTYGGNTYSVEDKRSNTEGGANDGSVNFRTSKIQIIVPKKGGGEDIYDFSMGDMVLQVVCKEDLPINVDV